MATTLQHQRSKTPATALAGPYGHPVHPMLIPIPIGAWVASLVFDVLSRTADDGAAFARGSLALIGIGVAGAVLAAVFGFMDYTRLASGTRASRTATIHMVLNLAVAVAFALSFFVRRGDLTGEVSGGLIALSAVSLLVLTVSGVLGGRMSYHYGVRVADEQTQAEAFEVVMRPNRLATNDEINAPQIDVGRRGTPPPGSRSPGGR